MGNWNSGRWQCYSKKMVVEDCLQLDARLLAKAGFFRSGYRGTWQWGKNWINLSYDSHALTLDYVVTMMRSGEKHRVTEPIRLTRTYPHFGGSVIWFVCSSCGRRVRKLYEPPGTIHFRCRHCYDLSYISAQEAHKYRSLYRMLARSMSSSDIPITASDVERLLNTFK